MAKIRKFTVGQGIASITAFHGFKVNSEDDQLSITKKINEELEKMILNNPEQWIWTHDRWRI